MAIPKMRIDVREGVFNVLKDEKYYLEEWDDYLLRLAKNGGKKHDTS
mgnify:CR=1 FL=1